MHEHVTLLMLDFLSCTYGNEPSIHHLFTHFKETENMLKQKSPAGLKTSEDDAQCV